MAWPSTKASTSNVNSDTNDISLARVDIKQNFDNVNNIIDMFDITTPSDNSTLTYNSTTNKFDTQSSFGVARGEIIVSLNASLESSNFGVDSAGQTYYDGGFTITGDNDTGISTFDSGYSYLRFQSGTYIVKLYEHSKLVTIPSSGGGPSAALTTDWRSDSTIYWEGLSIRMDFDKYAYQIGDLITFTEQTDIYIEYSNTTVTDYIHPSLIITRIQ